MPTEVMAAQVSSKRDSASWSDLKCAIALQTYGALPDLLSLELVARILHVSVGCVVALIEGGYLVPDSNGSNERVDKAANRRVLLTQMAIRPLFAVPPTMTTRE